MGDVQKGVERELGARRPLRDSDRATRPAGQHLGQECSDLLFVVTAPGSLEGPHRRERVDSRGDGNIVESLSDVVDREPLRPGRLPDPDDQPFQECFGALAALFICSGLWVAGVGQPLVRCRQLVHLVEQIEFGLRQTGDGSSERPHEVPVDQMVGWVGDLDVAVPPSGLPSLVDADAAVPVASLQDRFADGLCQLSALRR